MKFKHRQKLYNLMQNLIYPSMFGAFFVLFFQHYFNDINAENRFYQLDFLIYNLLLLYFIISYLVNESIDDLKIYNIATFSSDLIEIIVMFFAFSKIIEISVSKTNILNELYILLIWIPLTSFLWNFSLRSKGKYHYLNLLLILILIIMGFWLYKFTIANYFFLIIVYCLFFYYLFILLIKDKQFD